MDVAIHLGAHCTDADRLMKSLLRNREALDTMGVAVPGPSRYRDVLREVMNKLRGEVASHDTRDVVLETVLESDEPRRLVLSNPNFISMVSKAAEGARLYPKMQKAKWLRNVFPESPAEFFLAIRNPAAFVPALFAAGKASPEGFAAYLAGLQPEQLRWSETVEALRRTCPDCRVTVWCHEDSPLIWNDLLHALAGLDDAVALSGGYDMLRPIMSAEGMRRLRAYTAAHPPATPAVRRRVIAAFLDKFALEDEIEESFDLPGWTGDLITRLTEGYERDIDRVAVLGGVRLLMP